MPLRVVPPILYSLIVYHLIRLNDGPVRFLTFAVTMVLVNVVAAAGAWGHTREGVWVCGCVGAWVRGCVVHGRAGFGFPLPSSLPPLLSGFTAGCYCTSAFFSTTGSANMFASL